MSDDTQYLGGPIGRRTSSCATELVCRDCGYRTPLADSAFKCPACGEGLDIDYDYERATKAIAERGLEGRPWNIWRFEELLPIVSARCPDAGRPVRRPHPADPCRPARRRARPEEALPEGRLDQPPLALLQGRRGGDGDRPPARARQRRGRLRLDRQRRTAVAALAAKAGATAYVFYPGNMEKGKAKACRALGAQVCQLDGNYDQANRACRDSRWRAGSSSPTSPCVRSTPRGRRRWPSRSSRSSAGARPTTSSSRRRAARSPRASTRV